MSLKEKLLNIYKQDNDALFSFDELKNVLECEEKDLRELLLELEKDGIIYQFAPDGTTVRAWECFGLWPSSIPSNSFSYDGSKEMDISFDLQCDNILMVRDLDLLSGGNEISVANEEYYRKKSDYPWEQANYGSSSES